MLMPMLTIMILHLIERHEWLRKEKQRTSTLAATHVTTKEPNNTVLEPKTPNIRNES